MKKLEEEKKQERQGLAANILLGLCANSLVAKIHKAEEIVKLSILIADEFLKQINEPDEQ